MKRLFLTITIGLCSLLIAQTISAQDQESSLRDRIAKRQNQQSNSGKPPLTVRAQIMNESQTQEIDNAPWMREIYRFIDLEKEKNATLYYPVTPIGERTNLFTLIFRHLQNGDITVYRYKLGGAEVFTEENRETFKDVLEDFNIMYRQENGKFIVEDVDIPSNEVLGYYVKEAWYFDKNNSIVDIKTLAISPVIIRQDDFGVDRTRYPMFWVPYENIRPYTSRMPIMVSSLNNATTLTINDYFTKHLFEGDIEKTTNVRDLTLAQLYPDEAKRKEAQKKIEAQLKEFNANLWVYNDSVAANNAAAQANNKGKGPSIKNAPTANSTTGTTRATVQKEAKSQSAPARSMRNRKRN
ncbi:gliding motility associated protein GldN [Dysgonomonas alginatilytica]|uniref:Gliding motility associated protein GldN n=1 Tax=Dysgonomonas alginatilytica TaxID=1605892 RepID=A0A2V3PLS6_9BACT|nr:gliding motility protein GldN [Dysgonomonas alginatilytica]PXV62788.1 gliding motility associated protein GldN [Dysgonomonas alginatilytica]